MTGHTVIPGAAARMDPLAADPPRLSLRDAERITARLFGVEGRATPMVSERDQNVGIACADGRGFVLKISNPAEDPAFVEMQDLAMRHVSMFDPNLPVMRSLPTTSGSPEDQVEGPDGRRHVVRMVSLLPGRTLRAVELHEETMTELGTTSARLGRALRGFFHPAAGHELLWNIAHASRLRGLIPHIEVPERRATIERVLDRFDAHVGPRFGGLRAQVIHNDLTVDNTLFDDRQRITGILDFGDMAHTALVCDLVSTVEALMGDRTDTFGALQATARGYCSITPLDDDELDLLPDLLLTRCATTAVISAWRVRDRPENAEYITGWDTGVWAVLEAAEEMGYPAFRRQVAEAMASAMSGPPERSSHPSVAELTRRRRILGSAISPPTYERSLHLVSGRRAWLFDADGRGYLDAYNNVPVVGHCHPRVVDAIARQAATLNTNTRYLHTAILDLAERLVATMPEGLDTVMFVNSGSEANDLAWRLARTATGAQGAAVTAFAYHGVTDAIAALSPEEWRADGAPNHVATVPAPDTYRVPFSGRPDSDLAARYAGYVDEALGTLGSRGLGPAAMFVDAGFTSDGIFPPLPGYLPDAVGRWREAGGLFVADEVQVGFGRGGENLWGFVSHGVVPDIVTLGKPMGNGHPVAAVITRSDLVDRFARSTEWFSTFGGNPVACAAGLAVLDVIRDERVMERSSEVGDALELALRGLMDRHEAIGDIRRFGLLIGIDLVGDRAAREPATALAGVVQNQMRERGVLVGTTGPHGNVLKVRPPLVLSPADAEIIVSTLDAVLSDPSAD